MSSTNTTASNINNTQEKKLRLMVEDENWNGIFQLLKEKDCSNASIEVVLLLVNSNSE